MSPFTPIQGGLAALLAAAAIPVLAVQSVLADAPLALERDALSPSAEVSSLVVDPASTTVSVGLARGGASECFGNAAGNRCEEPLADIVARSHADLGVTANYSDGTSILGPIIVNGHAYTPANPNMVSLCVSGPRGQRQTLKIVRDPVPPGCLQAVSGEPLLQGGALDLPAGSSAAFWSSVTPGRRVQRTMVGLRGDGTLVVALASARRDSARDGMSLVDGARWMAAHGARDALALDGGHQSAIYSATAGYLVPMERPARLQSALLFTLRPAPVPPPAAPAPPTAASMPLPDTGLTPILPDTGLANPLPLTGDTDPPRQPRPHLGESSEAPPYQGLARLWTWCVERVVSLRV